jgi:hypothetical protein
MAIYEYRSTGHSNGHLQIYRYGTVHVLLRTTGEAGGPPMLTQPPVLLAVG